MMCLALYIASDCPLPTIAADALRPAFRVEEAVFYPSNPLREHGSKPFVYVVGCHLGCGCGFESDDANGHASRRGLAEFLAAALQHQAAVEVFICISGDESSPPNHNTRARPMDFLHYRSLFRIRQRVAVSDQDADGAGEKAATLQLQSQPPGAQVLMGDQVLGNTPLRHEVPAGLRQLTVKKDGFVTLTLRVPLRKHGAVDLGTIALARKDTLITIWRVGSPHGGDTPPALIPSDLEAVIAASGFHVGTRSFTATAFPGEFVKALEEDGAAGLPDIVAGNNFMPFEELMRSRPATMPRLFRVSGVLNEIGAFAFLVSRSPGHAAARQIATTNQGLSERFFSWSLDEQRWKDLPGQIHSEDNRRILEDLNCQAVSAYMGGDLHEIWPLLHKDMLGRPAAYDRFVVGDIRTVYMLGNSKLAFLLAAVSCWVLPGTPDSAGLPLGQELGCREVLSVWVKVEDGWSLFTITDDAVSVEATRKDIPRLAGTLVEGKGETIRPATCLARVPGIPGAPNEPCYDIYRWTPSSSTDLVAEIAEFSSDIGNRLFFKPSGEVSEGEADSRKAPWRVWSVGKDGRVVTSEVAQARATD